MLVALLSPLLTRSEPFWVVWASCAVHWACFWSSCRCGIDILLQTGSFMFRPIHNQLLQCTVRFKDNLPRAPGTPHPPFRTIYRVKHWCIKHLIYVLVRNCFTIATLYLLNFSEILIFHYSRSLYGPQKFKNPIFSRYLPMQQVHSRNAHSPQKFYKNRILAYSAILLSIKFLI
jgi:hypothetical protein